MVLRSIVPMVAALAAGSATALLSAVGIARAFGAPHEVLVSLAPKSVTASVAMGIAEKLGGNPALTAVLVIITGIIGAIVVTPLMNRLGIKDWRARGFAAGLASHGIGTARAFQVHPLAGTFAGIGMGLNAFVTALLVPVLLPLLLP
jgi:putative effector of murein hydrolase